MDMKSKDLILHTKNSTSSK